MSTIQPAVSDMLVTVKSRELQRGLLAEMSNHPAEAQQHFLAAAHLELVLAHDYENIGEAELSWRSRVSAASCFWRAGWQSRAQEILDALAQIDPTRAGELQAVAADLASNVTGA